MNASAVSLPTQHTKSSITPTMAGVPPPPVPATNQLPPCPSNPPPTNHTHRPLNFTPDFSLHPSLSPLSPETPPTSTCYDCYQPSHLAHNCPYCSPPHPRTLSLPIPLQYTQPLCAMNVVNRDTARNCPIALIKPLQWLGLLFHAHQPPVVSYFPLPLHGTGAGDPA